MRGDRALKKNQLSFWVILLICSIFISSSAYALQTYTTIRVLANQVKLEVNGEVIDAENFIYNGTTYVPFRKVAELLGKQVEWVEATGTVRIIDPQPKTVPPTEEIIPPVEEIIPPKETVGVGFVEHRLAPNVIVRVDPNVELLYIGAAAGAGFAHPSYVNDNHVINQKVRSYFGQYTSLAAAKNLHAVSLVHPVKKFSSEGEMTILSAGPDLGDAPVFNYPLQQPLYSGTTNIVTRTDLKNAVKDFQFQTKAHKFFADNRSLYEEMLQTFVKSLGFDYLTHLEDFFGETMDQHTFLILLSPSMVGGGAVQLEHGDGTGIRTNVNIMNPTYDLKNRLNLLYHETAHNFLTPMLQKDHSLLEQYTSCSATLKSTTSFENALNETLARVITNLMITQHHDPLIAQDLQLWYDRDGWRSTGELFDFVKDKYVSNRGDYDSFDKFLPEILKELKKTYDETPGERRLVMVGSSATLDLVRKYTSHLEGAYRQKLHLASEGNAPQIGEKNLKESVIIVAYILGDDPFLDGSNDAALGYSYNELKEAIASSGSYQKDFTIGNQRTVVLGAKDAISLEALLSRYSFSSLPKP